MDAFFDIPCPVGCGEERTVSIANDAVHDVYRILRAGT